MSYRDQSFFDGDVLTSQALNQFGENLTEVRTSHINTSPPQELLEGIWWLDNSSSPWELKIYTGSEWLVIAKIDEIEGTVYVQSGEQVTDSGGTPTISTTTFNVVANVIESTWESVGPTGSGADNIWTALDSLPGGVDWVELSADNLFGDATGASGRLDVYATRTGGTQAVDEAHRVFHGLIDRPTLSNVRRRMTVQFPVPVDSSGRFDIYWVQSVGTVKTCIIKLIGYGFNR